jgi:hypothetical protein
MFKIFNFSSKAKNIKTSAGLNKQSKSYQKSQKESEHVGVIVYRSSGQMKKRYGI